MRVRHTYHTLSDLERFFSPRLVRRLKSLLCVYRWAESSTVMGAVCVASVFVSEVLDGNRCLANNFEDMIHGYAPEMIVMDDQPLRYGDDDEQQVCFLWDVICLMLEEYEPDVEMPQWAYDVVGPHAYRAYEPVVLDPTTTPSYAEPLTISPEPVTCPPPSPTQTRQVITTQTQQTVSTPEGKLLTIKTITTTTITATNMKGEEIKEVIEAVTPAMPAQQVHIYSGNIGQKIDHIDTIGKQVVYGDAPKTQAKAAAEVEGELCHFIHPAVIDDDERLQIHKEICNLVRYNAVQDICAHLEDMCSDKKILLPISADNAMTELKRMGMPGEEEEGFAKKTFYKYYRKS